MTSTAVQASDGLRVVVVGSDASLRAVLTELLREEGFDVAQASTIREALSLACEQVPDLVVLDKDDRRQLDLVLLHDLGRSETTRRIPVLITTGHVDLEPGPNTGVVVKPFDLNVFLEGARRLLDRPG